MRSTPRHSGVASTAGNFTPQICHSAPETTYALSNRSSMLCMGGACPGPVSPQIGRFRIDEAEKRASLRFTSPADVTVRSIWLFVPRATAMGRTRVGLRDDLDGRPAPGPSAPTVLVRLRAGWQRVDLPANGHMALARCSVYHVLIEPGEVDDFGGPAYVELATSVSRFPVEFQPGVPSEDGRNPFLDLELAFLFQDSPAGLLARWDATHFLYGPIFVLECEDGSAFGQPYNDLLVPAVLGDSLLGQKITVPASVPGPLSVNYVGVFSQGRQLGQTDKLIADIYDVEAELVLSSTIVIGRGPGVINRAHWFGAALPGGGVSLFPERSYSVLLRSDGSGGNALGYELPSLRTTMRPTPGVEDPTYGGAVSHQVFSPDGGQSFFASAGRPDMPFLLAGRVDPDEPLAIYDEGGVYHADNSAALTAAIGEPLLFRFVVRNIGVAAGNLFFNLIDVATSNPLTDEPAFAANTPPNTDARGITVPVDAPSTPGRWRVDVRCGHVLSGGRRVVDDVVRFEVRVV